MKVWQLFTLFLLTTFLVAIPAHAATSYYTVDFDGASSYVTAGDIDLQSFTFFIILKPDTITGTHNIIDKRNQTYPNGGVGFVLQQYNQKLQLGIGSSSGYEWILSPTVFTDVNKDYAIAVAFDASTRDVCFYNGIEKIQQTTTTYVPSLNDISLTIAKSAFTSGAYFDGRIYLILIYNRALLDSEIRQIYRDPFNPPTNGLVIFYAPDSVDTTSNTWTDKSNNGNDGTIYEATFEQVSIPAFAVVDKNTRDDLTLNATVLVDEYEKIPSFLILPYSGVVTLSVSVDGYTPQTLTVALPTDYIYVMLESSTWYVPPDHLERSFEEGINSGLTMLYSMVGAMILVGVLSISPRLEEHVTVLVLVILSLIFFIYMLQYV